MATREEEASIIIDGLARHNGALRRAVRDVRDLLRDAQHAAEHDNGPVVVEFLDRSITRLDRVMREVNQ